MFNLRLNRYPEVPEFPGDLVLIFRIYERKIVFNNAFDHSEGSGSIYNEFFYDFLNNSISTFFQNQRFSFQIDHSTPNAYISVNIGPILKN